MTSALLLYKWPLIGSSCFANSMLLLHQVLIVYMVYLCQPSLPCSYAASIHPLHCSMSTRKLYFLIYLFTYLLTYWGDVVRLFAVVVAFFCFRFAFFMRASFCEFYISKVMLRTVCFVTADWSWTGRSGRCVQSAWNRSLNLNSKPSLHRPINPKWHLQCVKVLSFSWAHGRGWFLYKLLPIYIDRYVSVWGAEKVHHVVMHVLTCHIYTLVVIEWHQCLSCVRVIHAIARLSIYQTNC